MVGLQKQVATTFCKISVELVPLEKLEHVHPLVKEMFPEELKQNVPLGGRISHFVQSWEKLSKDHEILEIVKGYEIPLLRTPVQEKIPLNTPLKENQKFLVEKQIKEMFEKGAIKNVSEHKDQHAQNQFLSNLFLVKKGGGYRLVINLKTLNQFVPYMHFKMESLQTLKYDEGKRLHVQNRLEGRLFYNTSRQIMSSFGEVFMGRESLRFLCLCFGLGTASRVLTKILKVPISLLRRLNIRILIYLDDMLLMFQSIERLLIARDTVTFLLQHLGFVINF